MYYIPQISEGNANSQNWYLWPFYSPPAKLPVFCLKKHLESFKYVLSFVDDFCFQCCITQFPHERTFSTTDFCSTDCHIVISKMQETDKSDKSWPLCILHQNLANVFHSPVTFTVFVKVEETSFTKLAVLFLRVHQLQQQKLLSTELFVITWKHFFPSRSGENFITTSLTTCVR